MTRTTTQGVQELSPIKAMEIAASKIPGVISLAQGIPGFPTPRVITDFVCERIREGRCDKYSLTTGLQELREEISTSLQSEGLHYDPDSEIIVTVGSIEGITATLLACTNPGDEVIIPSPTYTSYQGAIRLARCTPVFAELDEENNFDINVSRIREKITKKTRAIFYCNPNNPTGTIFSRSATEQLAQCAAEHDLFIITDEVYKDFYYTDDSHETPARIPEMRSKVIRVCSFSKAFAMTGWRVGFLHTDAALASRILRYHDSMVTCAPVVSQYAAIAALRNQREILAAYGGAYRQRREVAIKAMDSLSDVLDYQNPKASYFVFPRVKDSFPLARSSRALALDILEKSRLALVPGAAFGPSGESHLRICFGREMEDLVEGMARLQDYFAQNRGSSSRRPIPAITPSTTARSQPSLLRAAARSLLARSAHLYCARNKPVIIGIAGVRGKTVIKRLLTELLSKHFAVRANDLSYNTEVGLPLSILRLAPPRSTLGRYLTAATALSRGIVAQEKAEYLILEYGVRSQGDAHRLLNIVRPDWLIMLGNTGAEPDDHLSEIGVELNLLACEVSPERLLLVENAGVEPPPGNRHTPIIPLAPGVPETSAYGASHRITREILGESSALGIPAAILLAEKLKVPVNHIRDFLLVNPTGT